MYACPGSYTSLLTVVKVSIFYSKLFLLQYFNFGIGNR